MITLREIADDAAHFDPVRTIITEGVTLADVIDSDAFDAVLRREAARDHAKLAAMLGNDPGYLDRF